MTQRIAPAALAALVAWASAAAGADAPAAATETRAMPAEADQPPAKNPALQGRVPVENLPRTEAEWRKRLTPQQFAVTRQKATDRAFTGEYTDTQTPGTYRCICCGEPLFRSDEKFHSGCGWPSFTAPVDGVKGKTIAEHEDRSHFSLRTEVTCRRCGAHLGHVFTDGPPPTGLRYCINSSAIVLDAKQPADGRPPRAP